MGELKPDPCPFCCARMVESDALRTRNRAVYVHELNNGSCPAANMILHSDDHERITAWNTRPRTEGRGEPNEHLTKRSSKPLSIVDRALMDEARERERDALLSASPIREPEISADVLTAMLAHHEAGAQEASEDMGAFSQEGGGMPPLEMRDRLHFHQAAVEQLHAILNLAPVGGWRPIETAPQQEPVLVGHAYLKGWQRIAIKNALGEWSYYDRPWLQQDPLDQPPTHWQTLPPPPQEQGGMK